MTENPPLLRKPDLLPSLPNKSWGLQVKKKKERNGGRGGGLLSVCAVPPAFSDWADPLFSPGTAACEPARGVWEDGTGSKREVGLSLSTKQPGAPGKSYVLQMWKEKNKAQATEEKKWRMKKRCKNKRHWASPPLLSLTVLFLLYQDATAVLFPSKDPRKHTTELYYRCKQFKQPVSLGLQDSFRQPSFTVSTLPTRLSPFSLSPPSPPLSVW